MVNVKTVQDIKSKLKDEDIMEKSERKRSLVSYMEYAVEKEVLKEECYLQKDGREFKNFEIEMLIKISTKMECSLIKYDNEVHICIDKEPDKEKIKAEISKQYVNNVKENLVYPLSSSILCIFSVLMYIIMVTGAPTELNYLNSWVNNRASWIIGVLICIFISSFIPAIIQLLKSFATKKQYLVEENGVYVLKKTII